MPRFSRCDRIRTGRDWGAARKSKDRVGTAAVSVSFSLGERQRLGVVVSSKVGNAVERNRIKRIFREYFRLHREEFPRGDCVIVAKPMASELTNGELRKEIRNVLEKTMR